MTYAGCRLRGRYPLAEAVFAEQIPGAKWFRDITI
jgi:hypothetical protein